jgi:hypothetical protein
VLDIQFKDFSMSFVTVKIDTRSKKAQHLIGLIAELSKTDKGISFVDSEADALKSIEQSFNELDLVRKGKLSPNPARNIVDQL